MRRSARRSSAGGEWTRREVLRVGAMAGLAAASGVAGRAGVAGAAAHPAFGRARSCLLVVLAGGPSHIDSFDPKPDAPGAVRGEFAPIATSVPGLHLCEHLPGLARRARLFAILRGMAHDDDSHAGASYRMLTGRAYPRDPWQSGRLSREDHPHIGSIVSAAEASDGSGTPPFLTVPGLLGSRGPAPAGQHAGALGRDFDPLVMASPHDARGALAARLGRRGRGRTEDRYGRSRFGLSLSLGLRLVEAGARFVQVNWDRGLGAGWDTHTDGFATLKDDLMPPLDRALSALLDDLAASGRMEETLVVVTGEFGRSPRVGPGGGRGHWPGAYSALVAGAGIAGGRAVGATDREGAVPVDCPSSPGDLASMILFALGVGGPGEVAPEGARPMLDLWS